MTNLPTVATNREADLRRDQAQNRRQFVLNTQKFLQNRDNTRQISPASAGSDHVTRSCGLCGFIPVVCTKRNNVSCERECSAIIIDDHLPAKAPNHIYLLNTPSAESATIVGGNKLLPQRENRSMDRSVDSIGSCSLDVDAESTDFSGISLVPIQSKHQSSLSLSFTL